MKVSHAKLPMLPDQSRISYTLLITWTRSFMTFPCVHHPQWKWSSASAMPTRPWLVDNRIMCSVQIQYQRHQDSLKHTWGTRCRTRWESLAASEGRWVSRAAGTPRVDGHYLPWGRCGLFLLSGPDWCCWCCVCFKRLERHQVWGSKTQLKKNGSITNILRTSISMVAKKQKDLLLLYMSAHSCG